MATENEHSGYELSRSWFDFAFENPEKVRPLHAAIYFFAIEHCNRLGWKKKFGFPTQMVMEAIGVKKYDTYIGALRDLIEWGFIELIEKSRNQYSSNVISIRSAKPKKGNALDKALICHTKKRQSTGQSMGQSMGQSTGESIVSINKQYNKEQETIKRELGDEFTEVVIEWLEYKKQRKETYKSEKSIKALCTKIKNLSEGNAAQAKAVIDQSMANNWAGLFELKHEVKKPERKGAFRNDTQV